MQQALLLEDDQTRGEYISELLRVAGYEVVWARSVPEAKMAWQSTFFDLATLDHDLGPREAVGDGCMFTCWVARRPDVCKTRFIVHSANIIDAPKMVDDLTKAGCSVAQVWPDSIGVFLKMTEK